MGPLLTDKMGLTYLTKGEGGVPTYLLPALPHPHPVGRRTEQSDLSISVCSDYKSLNRRGHPPRSKFFHFHAVFLESLDN